MSPTTTLPPQGSHFISLEQAIEITSLYRAEHENILASAYKNQEILPICETFNRYDIDILLEKEACAGLRIYFAMDPSLKVKVLVVAVNENGEDILPENATKATNDDDEGDIIQEAHRCPTLCPPSSPLNQP